MKGEGKRREGEGREKENKNEESLSKTKAKKIDESFAEFFILCIY